MSKVFQAGHHTVGDGVLEIDAITWAAKCVQVDNLPLGDGVEAHLLMEVDGLDEDAVMKEAEALAAVVESHGALDVCLRKATRNAKLCGNCDVRLVKLLKATVFTRKRTQSCLGQSCLNCFEPLNPLVRLMAFNRCAMVMRVTATSMSTSSKETCQMLIGIGDKLKHGIS